MVIDIANIVGSSYYLFEGLDSQIAHDLLVYCYGGKIENIEEKSDKLLAASDQVSGLVGGKPSPPLPSWF